MTDYTVNAKRSLSDVKRKIKLHLMPFFGGRKMAAISTADVRAYVAQRQAVTVRPDGTDKAGAANAQINRELAILKRAFRLATQAGKLLLRPHIPMLREDNVRQGFFEAEAFEAMRGHLPVDLRGIVTLRASEPLEARSPVLRPAPRLEPASRVHRGGAPISDRPPERGPQAPEAHPPFPGYRRW